MATLTEQSTAVFQAATQTADIGKQQELLQTAQTLAGDDALADAYKYLQKAVGLIAVTLPFMVAVGHELIGGHGMKGSISAYYYTHMGNYFVGSLCALGVFFLSYNHRPLPNYKLDNILSNIAGAMAIGVALFPTSSDGPKAHGGAAVVASVHLAFAGTLFALLAYFSLFLFTQSGAPENMTPNKQTRNLVYRICGYVIVAALAVILVTLVKTPPRSWHALYWLESIAVVAFGVSWLVKGEFGGILADP